MNLFLFIVILSNIFSISLLALGCQNINNYNAMIELNQPFHQPCYGIILSKTQININDMCCLDFINNNICTEEYKLCYREYPNYDSSKNPSKNPSIETNKNNNLEKEHLGLIIILSILNFIAIFVLVYLYRIHENIAQNDISPRRTRESILQSNPLYQDLETESDISERDSDSYTSRENIGYDGYDDYDNIDRYTNNYKYNDLYPETSNNRYDNDNRYDYTYDNNYDDDGYDKIYSNARIKNSDIYSIPMKPSNNEPYNNITPEIKSEENTSNI